MSPVFYLLALVTFSALTSAYTPSSVLNTIVKEAVGDAKAQFPKLQDNEISVSLIDLTGIRSGGCNRTRCALDAPYGLYNNATFYPASVIKLFYLAATHQFIQEGRFPMTDSLQRGLRDMIVDSDNEATQYIVDAITGAPNGLDLPPSEWNEWVKKRNTVNDYYRRIGYTAAEVNAAQKTYNSGPYGRDLKWLDGGKNRNSLTSLSAAKLMAEIATSTIVTPTRCEDMKKLLWRDMTTPYVDDQAHAFTALALDHEKDKLWSKAGWTSTARHDVALVEKYSSGKRVVISTFTVNHATEKQVIATVVRGIFNRLK